MDFIGVDAVQSSMDPVRSSVGGGIVATAALSTLLVADLLLGGTDAFVFVTVTDLCSVDVPSVCEEGSPLAAVISTVWFLALFVVAWPLLFGGFTWGLPGESGLVHGAVFGLILWSGYLAAALLGVGTGRQTFAETGPVLLVTVVAYLLYGLVLGGVYDRLATHRTFLSSESD